MNSPFNRKETDCQLVIRFLYIFNNLFQKNLLTIDSDSAIFCLEDVSTHLVRVLIRKTGGDWDEVR